MPGEIEVQPMGREEIKLKLLPRAPSPQVKTIRFRCKDALLSVRIVDEKGK